MSKKLSRLGFTLIELLVVVSIIGILTTLVAANLNAARSRARDAERKSDLRNVQVALRLYYNDHKFQYPASLNFGSEWLSDVGNTVYMTKIPQDPSPGVYYYYVPGSDFDSYKLYACLENKSDSAGLAFDTLGISSSNWTCPSGWVYTVGQ